MTLASAAGPAGELQRPRRGRCDPRGGREVRRHRAAARAPELGLG
jgi:hypothetical protein